MLRWSFAVSVFVLAGCAVGSTTGANDFDVADTSPADGGKESSVTYTPGGGDDDDDVDAGPTDAGKDSGGPTGPCAFTGTLATWDLGGLSGAAGQANVTSTATGVTGAPLKRMGVTAVSTNGSFNSSGWSTGALDTGKYLTASITAPSGCALTASSVSVSLEASGTGPSQASVATSADSFASRKTATLGSTQNVSVTADITAGQTLEVRIYGYNASAGTGTMRANSAITVTGSLH